MNFFIARYQLEKQEEAYLRKLRNECKSGKKHEWVGPTENAKTTGALLTQRCNIIGDNDECIVCTNCLLHIHRAKPKPVAIEIRPIYVVEPAGIPGYCIFCFSNRKSAKPTCSYGMHHEFFGDKVGEEKPVQQVKKKLDYNKCIKCNLHKMNPASKTSDCIHEYLKESDEDIK